MGSWQQQIELEERRWYEENEELRLYLDHCQEVLIDDPEYDKWLERIDE